MLSDELRQVIAETAEAAAAKASAETRKHFDVVAEDIKGEVKLLAEALQIGLERTNKRIDDLDEKLEKTTSEIRDLIKFTYGDLDRRVTVLEQSSLK